jgi:hypothetical protein
MIDNILSANHMTGNLMVRYKHYGRRHNPSPADEHAQKERSG